MKAVERGGTTTSWTIHTMGGPVRRIFSTIEIAKQWAIAEWTKTGGNVVIEAGYVEELACTFSIRHEGPHERVFATICEQLHCACCGRVIATRSNIDGAWTSAPNGHDHWPKDLEVEP